jgi:hypothetical protein
VEYLILRILVIPFILTYCKNLYNIKKLLDIQRNFERQRFFLERNNLFLSAYRANIAENAQYRREFSTIIK